MNHSFNCLKDLPFKIINTIPTPDQNKTETIHFKEISKLFYNATQKADLKIKPCSELGDLKEDWQTIEEKPRKTDDISVSDVIIIGTFYYIIISIYASCSLVIGTLTVYVQHKFLNHYKFFLTIL